VTATEDQTVIEIPIFFPAGEDTLFGIRTLPAGHDEERSTAVVVLSGGGTPLSTGVNGFSVRVCRLASSAGFHSLRFDYHGVGESTGDPDRFHLGAPHTDDLEGALQFLTTVGIRRSILIGECFGARTALSVAASTHHDVLAVLAISPPIRDFEMGERMTTRLAVEHSLFTYVRRGLRPRTLKRALGSHRRAYARVAREKLRSVVSAGARSPERADRYVVSSRFLDPLRLLSERGIPTQLVYGDHDDFTRDLQRAGSSVAPFLTKGSNPNVLTIPGRVHGLASSATQSSLIEFAGRWLSGLARD
jgi:pimeloyl-ACP methyl ester carboxylesterase